MKKELIIVSFSGGRTSGYMCYILKKYFSHIYDFKFCFMNTGQEHENTLEFVNNVDKFLNLDLIWLEARIQDGRKGTEYEIVTFETADREGIYFEDMVSKFGLPDMNHIHCTREMKLRPIQLWKKNNGYKDCREAIGIRYDEFRRVKADKGYIYPLANFIKTTKEDVLSFWSKQPFDLEIPEHLGNCIWCYKKSDKKLKQVSIDMPEAFDFVRKLESKYSMIKNTTESNIEPRKMFRHNRNSEDIFNDTNLPYVPTWIKSNGVVDIENIENCGEECGVITVSELDDIEKSLLLKVK